jgi:hypothetical protein
MNNFVFGSGDPLLYGNNIVRQEYNEPEIKKQLDTVMMQYQQLQQSKQDAPAQKDWIGEFDSTLKRLDADIANALSTDQEFVQLNAELQQSIQDEIMLNIKWKLNSKQEVIYKVKRLNEIIESYNKEKASRDRQQMAEISEYLQNYSDMTFNEYKKMKESK